MTQLDDVGFEPMKAATLDHTDQVTWPVLASPKLDGIRCVVRGGVALSYNLKPIRNGYVQAVLGRAQYNGLDGELIVGAHNDDSVLNRTQSGVMKSAGHPDFRFYVFDDFSVAARDYRYRIGRVEDRLEDYGNARMVLVAHERLTSSEELATYEGRVLGNGFEGVILRHPAAPYKYGRATAREGWLWKVKRFYDAEAYVYAVEEGQANHNPATKDALGRTARSSSKAGMRPNGAVGTIKAVCLATGLHLDVAPGRLSAAQRKEYFEHPERLVYSVINYRAFKYGMKDLPRFPTYQSMRDPDTLSTECAQARLKLLVPGGLMHANL